MSLAHYSDLTAKFDQTYYASSMDGRGIKPGYRLIGVTFVVAALHAAIIAWVLSLTSSSHRIAAPAVIAIEFADTPVLPEPPQPSERLETPSAPMPVTEPVRASPAAPDTSPTILMQRAETAREIAPASSIAAEEVPKNPPNTVDPETLASVLQNMSCQHLSYEREKTCPMLDPFAVAEASAKRQEAAPSAPILIGEFGPKSVLESFMNQKDSEPYLMPGMSADLFTDGIGSAAYNAQRIRNGQAPIWDRDLEEAFARSD